MQFKATYSAEGEEPKTWTIPAEYLISAEPTPYPAITLPAPSAPPSPAPGIEEVIREVRKNDGFWRGGEFIFIYNIKSIIEVPDSEAEMNELNAKRVVDFLRKNT